MENTVFNPDEGIKQDAPVANPKPKKEKKPKAAKPYGVVAGYRTLAVATLVLTIGGLFLGLLGNAVWWMSHTYYSAQGAEALLSGLPHKTLDILPEALNGSLLNYIILFPVEALTGLFGMLTTQGINFGSVIGSVIELLFQTGVLTLLFVALVAAPICTLVAVCSRKRARSASIASAVLSFLSYGLLFLWNFSKELLEKGWELMDIDLPIAIIAGCLFVGLAVTAILRNKVRGGMMVASVCCTLAMIVGLVYPGSLVAADVKETFSFTEVFVCIMVFVLHLWLFYHVVATCRRLTSKKCYGYDIARYAVLLVLLLVYIVASCTRLGGFAFDLPFAGKENIISMVLLLAGCVVGLGVSITAKVLQSKKEAKEYAEEDYQDQNQNAYGYDPAYAPAYAPQPMYYSPYMPVAVPVAPAPIAPVAPQPEPVKEPTEFEREMLAIAAAPAPAPAPVQPAPVPVYIPQAASVAQPEKSSAGDAPYVYDPFFTTLTTAEKDEFCDLFIQHKQGKIEDVPDYVVGGDNVKFFNKVWIRYSRFEMSFELKEKIFRYLRTLKK